MSDGQLQTRYRELLARYMDKPAQDRVMGGSLDMELDAVECAMLDNPPQGCRKGLVLPGEMERPESVPVLYSLTLEEAGINVMSDEEILAAIADKDRTPPNDYVKVTLNQGQVGCHDEKTEVLTDAGWQSWQSYNGTSLLATINPLTHKMEFQKPTDLHAYDYDGMMYCAENTSTDFCVTPNHRMYVRPWNERIRTLNPDYLMKRADSLGWYSGLLAAPSGFCGTELTQITVGNRIYDGDDFLALVALVASDGWVGGAESTWRRTSFCCFRDDRIGIVRPLAARLGFVETKSRPGVWEVSDPALAHWMRTNLFDGEVYRSPHKHIPSIIKCASQRQIELFLKFYGDQSTSGSRRAFFTSSTRMADDIQELLLRIGKRCGTYERAPRSSTMKDGRHIDADNCTKDITITEWGSKRQSIERRSTRVEHYKGPVFCATVPNSILVTRRNGKVLISGNSCGAESAVGGLMCRRNQDGHEHVTLNPYGVYAYTSGGVDRGSTLHDNLAVLQAIGCPSEKVWPRSKGWRAKPNTDALADAAKYRVAKDGVIRIKNRRELQTMVLAGYPIYFGYTGHAIFGVDLLDLTRFVYQNSWGASWGNGGRGTLTYDRIYWGYGVYAIIALRGKD